VWSLAASVSRWPVSGRSRLASRPWQLDPVQKGPLRCANFFVVLVDGMSDDGPHGHPCCQGAERVANFVAPAKHPQTDQMGSAILSGWATNVARRHGFSQVYRPASVEGWSDIILRMGQLGGRC
jgi:hypothetical protein